MNAENIKLICIFATLEPPIVKRVNFTVVITVDRCTCSFIAALKQSTLFAEFHTCSPNLNNPRTDEWKETKAIRLMRSQCTIRMILKLIFQGKNLHSVTLKSDF